MRNLLTSLREQFSVDALHEELLQLRNDKKELQKQLDTARAQVRAYPPSFHAVAVPIPAPELRETALKLVERDLKPLLNEGTIRMLTHIFKQVERSPEYRASYMNCAMNTVEHVVQVELVLPELHHVFNVHPGMIGMRS